MGEWMRKRVAPGPDRRMNGFKIVLASQELLRRLLNAVLPEKNILVPNMNLSMIAEFVMLL